MRGGRKQKFFEHLPGRDLIAVVGRDVFGDFADVIDDALFVVECAAFLIVIADVDGLPDFDLARVGFDAAGDDFEQRRFARAVRADDADAVVAFEQIGEIVDQLPLAVRFRNVVDLDDFRPEPFRADGDINFALSPVLSAAPSNREPRSMRCFDLRVRAFAPRRSQASSFFISCSRL